MKFTAQEMVFLDSVSQGPKPFGLSLPYPAEEDKEGFLRDTLEGLKKKGVVGMDGKLEKRGVLPIKAMEDYKNAEIHIIVNQMFCALTAEKQMVAIAPSGMDYELTRVSPYVILELALKNSEFMCLAESSVETPPQACKISQSEWAASYAARAQGKLLLAKFRASLPVLEKMYHWEGAQGYEYDFYTGQLSGLTPRQMRCGFMDFLEIPVQSEAKIHG